MTFQLARSIFSVGEPFLVQGTGIILRIELEIRELIWLKFE